MPAYGRMMATVLYMSMSLDGFIAGPNEEPGHIERLHHWFFVGEESGAHGVPGVPKGVNGTVIRELMDTGATVAPRRTFEQAEGWNGDHHNGVPIFILSRRPAPDDAAKWPLVTYLPDVGDALRRARRRRATATSSCTAVPAPWRGPSRRASSTRSRCTSSPCSWAAVASSSPSSRVGSNSSG